MHPSLAHKQLLYLKLLFTVCAFIFCNACYSQAFQFKTYSFNNSISSYNAGKIVQDAYGFIWVCTQEGINRFDGKDFIAIKKDPLLNTGLSENYVTDVSKDDSGHLWISTALGGVDQLNPENFAIKIRLQAAGENKGGLVTNWIRSLSWSREKELWVGTYYGISVYNKAKNTWLSFTENPFNKLRDLNISFMQTDGQGNMWIAAENDGIIIYNTAAKKVTSLISKKEFGVAAGQTFNVYGLYIDKPGSVYICCNKGLKHVVYDGAVYKPAGIALPALKSFYNIAVKALVKDNEQRYWVGTGNGITVLNEAGVIETLQHSNFFYNTLLDDNVNYIFKDRAGDIWVSTTKGLNLLINDQYHFQAFNAKSGGLSEMNSINTIYPDNDSTIYACAGTGLFKINIKTFKTGHILQSDNYGEMVSILRLNSKGFLVSSAQELLFVSASNNQYLAQQAFSVFKELSPIQYHYFSSMMRYNDSIILLGSMEDEGLLKWDIKNHVLKQFKSGPGKAGLYEDNIHNIKKDRAGNIWLLCNSSITRFDPVSETFKNYFPQIGENKKYTPHFFFDMYDDGQYLWLTSYGFGLIRFNVKQNSYTSFTERDGLSSNATYNVLDENDSTMWISSNRGLTRFSLRSGRASRYFSADGLQSDAFDERSACKIGASLFLGGLDGFTRITKNDTYTPQKNIPVYVGKISLQDKKGELIEINSLHISDTVLRFSPTPVTFYIMSPDYSNSSRDMYAYKIEELSGQWTQLGQVNKITIAGLSPGTYHFRARIYNRDNTTTDSAMLVFTILPEWYQTLVFKIGIVCICVLLFFLFYWLRMSQLQKQQQIRQNIASDLHDDFGSTINSVKIYTHLVEVSEEKHEYLNRIKESLGQATTGLRDMIWVLDDKNDTTEDLVQRIRLFALPFTGASNITLNLDSDGLPNTKLKKTEKRNLLLIAKEAINNCVKYAGCNMVDIKLGRTNGKMYMVIQDNGNGFEADNASNGNGLRNMQLRAKQIKYKLDIQSAKGRGTTIKVYEK